MGLRDAKLFNEGLLYHGPGFTGHEGRHCDLLNDTNQARGDLFDALVIRCFFYCALIIVEKRGDTPLVGSLVFLKGEFETPSSSLSTNNVDVSTLLLRGLRSGHSLL